MPDNLLICIGLIIAYILIFIVGFVSGVFATKGKGVKRSGNNKIT